MDTELYKEPEYTIHLIHKGQNQTVIIHSNKAIIH